jgi:hypothetical protein
MDLNKNQAEAIFKRKAGQASGAETARKEYEESASAIRQRTAQLRSLRLAKEAADKEAHTKQKRSRSSRFNVPHADARNPIKLGCIAEREPRKGTAEALSSGAQGLFSSAS